MNAQDRQREALGRAQGGQSWSNYPAIFQGFLDKGISEHEIQPRVNVFTFNAWKALGRVVCKGEKGIRVLTWIPIETKDEETDEVTISRRPKTAIVFHVSQTKALA